MDQTITHTLVIPDISIIIPCYNSGSYIQEAIDSVLAYSGNKAYEIIIINDGSDDAHTLSLLALYSGKGYTVLSQENKGPAAARNCGCQHARSEYLLFLDSDNKIRPEYIDKGIEILDKFPDVGVVHGNPAFFGDTINARFNTRPFDFFAILMSNYIDICTVIRKKVWQDTGGFDEAKILFGHEDWEFWIRVGASAWKFHHIEETLFDYRVRHNSLIINSSGSENIMELRKYVYNKHLEIYIRHHRILYELFLIYQNDTRRPFRSFTKYFYRKFFVKLPQTAFR